MGQKHYFENRPVRDGRIDIQVEDYGVEHAQYFQGHGLLPGGRFEYAFLGTGANGREAYNDAIEQAEQSLDGTQLPRKWPGVKFGGVDREVRRAMREEGSELYYYVGIRIGATR